MYTKYLGDDSTRCDNKCQCATLDRHERGRAKPHNTSKTCCQIQRGCGGCDVSDEHEAARCSMWFKHNGPCMCSYCAHDFFAAEAIARDESTTAQKQHFCMERCDCNDGSHPMCCGGDALCALDASHVDYSMSDSTDVVHMCQYCRADYIDVTQVPQGRTPWIGRSGRLASYGWMNGGFRGNP